MNFQNNAQENAYYQEWAYVQGRKFLLILLALGSLLVTFRIGGYVGNLIFPSSPAGFFFIRMVFVALGYAGIDWVLANALASASNVSSSDLVMIDDDTGEEIPLRKGQNKRSVWVFAISALVTTVGLSLASNFFVSSEMAGESHLIKYNNQVTETMRNDSLMKMRAFDALENAGQEERQRIEEARAEKTRMIAAAVATGSESWQRDYQLHKNNLKAWFWTCRDCPREYRRYRERIKTAMSEGDRIVAEARGYTQSVQSALSPTLSYQMATDSVLSFVKQNVLSLEAERKSRERKLNIILLVLTIGAGILALILTLVLKEHRKEHGQLVPEDHVRLVMVIMDMLDRLGSSLSDLVYTLIAQPFHWFKRKGYIKTYRLQPKRVTATPHGSVTNDSEERKCQNCGTDISHKRSDAKFCGDSCRMEYHNFVPGRNKSNGVGA